MPTSAKLLHSLFIVAALCCGDFSPADAETVEAATPAQQQGVDFGRDVLPILNQHCFKCHGSKRRESGLRLSDFRAAMRGGDSGQAIIVPGMPEGSRLIKVVSGQDPELTMPPREEGRRLTGEEIDVLERWIREGAKWPPMIDAGSRKQLFIDDQVARPTASILCGTHV